MYELKKNGKVFTSNFVGTGPSSYDKRVYQTAVLQGLRNTALDYLRLLTVTKFVPPFIAKFVISLPYKPHDGRERVQKYGSTLSLTLVLD
jgi:hypothetical protein